MQIYLIHFHEEREKEMERDNLALKDQIENLDILLSEIQRQKDKLRLEMEQGKPAAQCRLRIKIIGRLLELTDDQNDEIRDILDDVIGDEEEYGKD